MTEIHVKTKDPVQALNKLILGIGDACETISDPKDFLFEELAQIIGYYTLDGIKIIVSTAETRGFVEQTSTMWDNFPYISLKLTFDGWVLYNNLRKENSESSTVFMAMPYGKNEEQRKEFTAVFEKCFEPSVDACGLSLLRLDRSPKAGNISNRIRIEIRTAKFVIADLTYGNSGAYFEAGFAEGIGKKVIYACRKDQFKNLKKYPHFDVNQHYTIKWSTDEYEPATLELKECIRNSFTDVRMRDKET